MLGTQALPLETCVAGFCVSAMCVRVCMGVHVNVWLIPGWHTATFRAALPLFAVNPVQTADELHVAQLDAAAIRCVREGLRCRQQRRERGSPLTCDGAAADNWGSFLMNTGFLVQVDDGYRLSAPYIGSFRKQCSAGRAELLSLVKRQKFGEMKIAVRARPVCAMSGPHPR